VEKKEKIFSYGGNLLTTGTGHVLPTLVGRADFRTLKESFPDPFAGHGMSARGLKYNPFWMLDLFKIGTSVQIQVAVPLDNFKEIFFLHIVQKYDTVGQNRILSNMS
jgi:hypothetical protein